MHLIIECNCNSFLLNLHGKSRRCELCKASMVASILVHGTSRLAMIVTIDTRQKQWRDWARGETNKILYYFKLLRRIGKRWLKKTMSTTRYIMRTDAQYVLLATIGKNQVPIWIGTKAWMPILNRAREVWEPAGSYTLIQSHGSPLSMLQFVLSASSFYFIFTLFSHFFSFFSNSLVHRVCSFSPTAHSITYRDWINYRESFTRVPIDIQTSISIIPCISLDTFGKSFSYPTCSDYAEWACKYWNLIDLFTLQQSLETTTRQVYFFNENKK